MGLGERIGRGNTADIYVLGADQVLKVFRDPKLLELEQGISNIIEELAVGAPKFYGNVEIDGFAGLAYERIMGPSMLEILMGKPEQAVEYGRQLAQLHAKLHSVKASGRLQSIKSRLADTISLIRHVGFEPFREAVESRLSDLPAGEHLCHGDFHPGNVLLSQQGPVVIDWMTAVCGPAQADAARTILILRHAVLPAELPEVVRQTFAEIRTVLLQSYEDTYLELTGYNREELTKWELPLMAARLVESVPEEEQRTLLALIQRQLS
ncbi:phosphotransferase family protein [Paenibacillus aceris]|uniref:Aminoglycoside phosphotransferase (APT) family kinase protein n=1 Tax=Paenibacillus aceris TaxID=869555 RepID=A0ABS4HXP5_9BACL|nr:aminoglycoside phosphotransferase family protein [Paenibacillus aceris]MBP1963260.1 aminoglycoside phosphotransferase (APT) family kinase protein [Paenibacillus aceris]NHW38628.1 aminoglycoside phosphotransferase family protein [Paenibacillus aceris]